MEATKGQGLIWGCPHVDPLSPCYPDPDPAAQDPGPGSGRRSASARDAEPAAHVPDDGGGCCAADTHVLAHLPPGTVSCRPGLQLPHSSRLARAPPPALQARALPPSQGAHVACCTPATINLMGSAQPPLLTGRGRWGAERAASLMCQWGAFSFFFSFSFSFFTLGFLALSEERSCFLQPAACSWRGGDPVGSSSGPAPPTLATNLT